MGYYITLVLKRGLKMRDNIDILLKNEDKIRNHWFNSFLLINFMPVIYEMSVSVASVGFLNTFASLSNGLSFLMTLLFIPLSPLFWITYHCAYKKRGVMWITLVMLSLVIGFFASLIFQKKEFTPDLTGLYFILLATLPSAIFWYCSYKLREVNLARFIKRPAAQTTEDVLIEAECEVL